MMLDTKPEYRTRQAQPVEDDARDITQLLHAHREGDRAAFDRLMPLVYGQLKRLAHSQLRAHRVGRTLDTTALVHETYLKLARQDGVPWRSRGEFFAIAARAMRQLIVDYARERNAQKRGGGRPNLTLEESRVAVDQEAEKLLQLDQIIEQLNQAEPRLVRIIECRFFAGLTENETAEALSVSARTVQRDWAKARAWLAVHAGGE